MRKLAVLLILIATQFLVAETKGSADVLELQGEKLGESLSSFVSLHPKAHCIDSSKTIKDCFQWEDVVIFGLAAQPDATCSISTRTSPACVQGLTAQFSNDHLILLTYAVPGTNKTEPSAALKKTYGAPEIDTPEATIWSLGRGTLSVVVGKAIEGDEAESLITFTLFSS